MYPFHWNHLLRQTGILVSAITRIHVGHIATAVIERYADKLNLMDVASAQAHDREMAMNTRGLAAFLLQSMVPDLDETAAARHVTDGTNDNGIDALYVDGRENRIYVVQTKWQNEGVGTISVGDMHKTISGIRDLTEERFDRFNSKFASVLPEVESALSEPSVTFVLVVGTTGATSLATPVQNVIDDALSEMNEISEMLMVRVLGLSELHQILREGGAAAKIDADVTLEGWGAVSEPYAAFYGVVDGSTVAKWYLEHGGRLFDDNLRKALGYTTVNSGLLETIEKQPESFWYFNNGVTVLCDSVSKTGKGGASRVTGEFVVRGMRVVNGAQTVSSLAEKYKAEPNPLDPVRVWIRLISLEGCPDEFATDVTRATNTQNVVENRDFISLDPNQQRLQDDIKLSLSKHYVFKRGDLIPNIDDGCSVAEAIVALACSDSDSGLAVLAKSAVGRLEDTRGRYYPRLFRDSTTAYSVWQSVLINRAVDRRLIQLRDASQGKRKAVATQGNRLIAHAVFQQIKASNRIDDKIADDAWQELLKEIPDTVESALGILSDHVESFYSTNYITSLFKNAAKCSSISAAVNKGLGVA